MKPPEWTNKYVGIPYREMGRTPEGVDCWGLVRLVLLEELGIATPCLATEYTADRPAEDLQDVAREEAEGNWWPVDWDDVQEYDVVLLALQGFDQHVGIVVAPGWMIHTEKKIDTVLDRYDRARWRRRVRGFFRHETLHAARTEGGVLRGRQFGEG